MKAPLSSLVAFHQDPTNLPKLIPPPLIMKIRQDERTSLTEGVISFTLWFGPIPVRWTARHEPGPTEHSFADVMEAGPLARWRHEHIFEPDGDGSTLTDRITLAHKKGILGLITRLTFDGFALSFLFLYRHMRTKRSIE